MLCFHSLQKIICDWAVNHTGDFRDQLEHGYRVLDLRICHLPTTKSFHWWHGVAGADITDGLQQIKKFLVENPKEIVMLRISHLKCPGTSKGLRKLEMPTVVTKELGDLIFSLFSDHLLPSSLFRGTTTFDEIWKTGKNVFVFIEDTLFNRLGHAEHFTYNWADRRVHGAKFEFLTNPHDVLHFRDNVLSAQRRTLPNDMTYNPMIVTHQTKNVVGALLRNTLVQVILFSAFAQLLCLYQTNDFPRRLLSFGEMASAVLIFLIIRTLWLSMDFLAFEGRAENLIEMAKIANTSGMSELTFPASLWYPPTRLYNGGFNAALRAWSADPKQYKLNIITVDDFHSSEIVDIAISFLQTQDSPKNI